MVWKLYKRIIIAGCMILAGLSSAQVHCGGSREMVKKEVATKEATGRYDESFDPLTLEDDDLVIAADSTIAAAPVSGESTAVQQSLPAVSNEAEGFRVQIMATNNISSASLTEQEANARFGPSGHKVYLLFEAPLYKIRVGDFLERNAAEELRDKAKEYGYGGAFVVKSKINSGN